MVTQRLLGNLPIGSLFACGAHISTVALLMCVQEIDFKVYLIITYVVTAAPYKYLRLLVIELSVFNNFFMS